MSEPIRHSASPRNRRKILHHIENLKEQIEQAIIINLKERERLNREYNLIIKIENRAKAEV